MARQILCPNCKKEMQSLATQYSELFEFKEGEAIKKMRCDDCGNDINVGDSCFASVLLPSALHPNYEIQKPSAWAHDYIK